jgi:hypothetical protein
MSKERIINDDIKRFKSKFIVDENTGCWIWVGSYSKTGYGEINIKGKTMKAHRFSYQTFIGELDKDLMICHNCNNPKCVNPDHLRQDTRSSNAIDMTKINTLNTQKLTIEQVIEIKKDLLNIYPGQVSFLARKYNVLQANISHIKKGRNWSHVKI